MWCVDIVGICHTVSHAGGRCDDWMSRIIKFAAVDHPHFFTRAPRQLTFPAACTVLVTCFFGLANGIGAVDAVDIVVPAVCVPCRLVVLLWAACCAAHLRFGHAASTSLLVVPTMWQPTGWLIIE